MKTIVLEELWQAFSSAIPGIILALVLLLAGWLLGRLLFSLTGRILRRLKFDDAASRAGVVDGLKQAGFQQTPSRLIAGLILWATILSFAMLAFDALGLDAVLLPLQALLSYLPRVLAAGVAFVGGLLLAQIIGRATQAALVSFGIEIHEVGGKIVRSLVIIITVLVAVEQLKLDISVLSDAFVGLVIVAAGGVALAFALGAQGIARSILAGYYARDNLKTGDRVLINNREGVLEAIGPVYSEVSQGDDILLIPNQRLLEDEIVLKSGNQANPQ